MPTQIAQPVRTKTTGKEGGANVGRNIGAGLGAVIGGVAAGTVTGGMGAAQGAALGASLGGTAGGIAGSTFQPETRQTEQSQLAGVPVSQLAANSQKLLDGVRALNSNEALAAKFQTPLTQAYIQTQMELKRRG